MVQAYLPEVTKGDKRIILIDGMLGRLTASRLLMARSNMHVGGQAMATDLSADLAV